MSNVPEQVRRAAERATEIQAQAYGAPGEPTTQVEPVAPDPQVPPVEPVPAPVAEAPQAPVVPVPPVESDWEQKYRTLQGVLRAETTKLRATIADHEATIASLQAQPVAPAVKPPAPGRDPRDEETYGTEMLDLIERRAAALVQAEMEKFQPQLEQTRTQVESISRQVYETDAEKFYGELERAVPDYASINVDQRFLDWLGEIDPLSGMPRQAYLTNAGQHLDHVRAANLFNAFKATLAPPAAPAPVQAASAPTPLSPSPRPVGAASAPRMEAPAVGEVRRSEIGAHYKRVSTDATYRGSAAQTAFEDRMQAALAAGKVVEG